MKILKVACNCKQAHYCDTDCQNEDRLYHEEVCSFLNRCDKETFSLTKVTKHSRQGLAGINNLGNTCYMNSANQCLSNIPHLRSFLFSDQMLEEINVTNVLGTKGDLALRFTQLLGKLWCDVKPQVDGSPFKRALNQSSTMFANNNQHDSQEYLAFLLDALHEDLNRILEKPYVEKPELQGNDVLVSKVYLTLHLQRN